MKNACMRQLLEDQMAVVNRKFTGLRLDEGRGECYSIVGILEFKSGYEGKEIEDSYNIEILIPDDYPDTVPRTRSVDGKVPKDFHTYPENLTFCTGAPLGEKLIFFEDPTLKGYIEKLLVPYLFSYSCLQKYGELPYSELGHGAPGILSYYKELFNTEDDFVALRIMTFLANGKYKGHYPCPCGKDKKLRDCHGSLILKMMKYHSKKDFEVEYINVFSLIKELHGDSPVFIQYIPNSMRNSFSRKRRRSRQNRR